MAKKRFYGSKEESMPLANRTDVNKENRSKDDGVHRNVNHSGYMMRDREQYAGREETKLTMGMDGRMIKEDWNATALLPTGVIDRDWPRASSYNMGMTPTLFSGVQAQIKEDEEDMRREFSPGKY